VGGGKPPSLKERERREEENTRGGGNKMADFCNNSPWVRKMAASILDALLKAKI
jgi:hypothetical protein